MTVKLTQNSALLLTSIASACVLAACGGGSNSPAATTTYSGVVAAAAYVPGSASGDPTIKAGYYAGATVFVDTNSNGKLDAGEPSAKTDASGHFTLQSAVAGQLVADIATSATNTATAKNVTSHLILRVSADQIADQGTTNVVIARCRAKCSASSKRTARPMRPKRPISQPA